jgi:hypothetical protein
MKFTAITDTRAAIRRISIMNTGSVFHRMIASKLPAFAAGSPIKSTFLCPESPVSGIYPFPVFFRLP